jgi:hypothetical protein
MAGHRRAGWAKVQVRVRVVLRIFRRSVAVSDPSVSDSARRRQQARVRMSIAAQNSDRNLRFASQSRRRLPARLLVKRAAREKEGKAPMVNLLARRHQEVERQLQRNAAQRSHNTERSNQRKERRRPDHNNSGFVIITELSWECCSRLAMSRRSPCDPASTGTQRHGYNSSAIWTAFNAAPLSN